MIRTLPALLAALLAPVPLSSADVSLPKIFTDNMVLQQQLPIAVWGTADPIEAIKVEFNGARAETKAGEDGRWRVDLPAMEADGKAHTLTVTGNHKIEFKDVLLGEVWLCAGQSNMNREAPMDGDRPEMRLFWIAGSTVPQRDDLGELIQGWTPATVADVAPVSKWRQENVNPNHKQGFAEVGYVFGKKIQADLDVPVGLIKCAFGGSQAQSWTPHPDVESLYKFGEKVEGSYLGHRPGLLYQSMLHGIVPFTIRGVVWYQGENDGRNRNYAEDLTKMIGSWRKLWGREDMPFYMAQIAQTTYASGMLGVWEAQVEVMHTVPHTAVASSNNMQDKSMRVDEGNPDRGIGGTGWPIVAGSNPHPPNKHIVAERIADIALANTYDRIEREVLPPVYDSHRVEANKIIVKLRNTGGGLITDDGEAPNWFELSDGSKADERPNALLVFKKAEAKIIGPDTIELTCPGMEEPKYARFAWHALARHNLSNKEGIPAISFRTDDLPQMWNRR